MSWQFTRTVLDRYPSLPQTRFRVLLVLAEEAPLATRSASPPMDLMMHRANVCGRTVQRSLRDLEKMGLIECVSVGAWGRSSVYKVLIEATQGDTQESPYQGDTQVSPNGDVGRHPSVALQAAAQGDTQESPYGFPSRPEGDTQESPIGRHPGVAPYQYQEPNKRPSDEPGSRERAGARGNEDHRQEEPRALTGRVWPRDQGRPVSVRAGDLPPDIRDLCPRGCGKAHGSGPCPLDAGGPPPPPRRPVQDPEVAHRGRARVDAAIAAARAAGGGGAEPARPRTEDEKRNAALRQVAASRAERGASPHPSPSIEGRPDDGLDLPPF